MLQPRSIAGSGPEETSARHGLGHHVKAFVCERPAICWEPQLFSLNHDLSVVFLRNTGCRGKLQGSGMLWVSVPFGTRH